MALARRAPTAPQCRVCLKPETCRTGRSLMAARRVALLGKELRSKGCRQAVRGNEVMIHEPQGLTPVEPKVTKRAESNWEAS